MYSLCSIIPNFDFIYKSTQTIQTPQSKAAGRHEVVMSSVSTPTVSKIIVSGVLTSEPALLLQPAIAVLNSNERERERGGTKAMTLVIMSGRITGKINEGWGISRFLRFFRSYVQLITIARSNV